MSDYDDEDINDVSNSSLGTCTLSVYSWNWNRGVSAVWRVPILIGNRFRDSPLYAEVRKGKHFQNQIRCRKSLVSFIREPF